MIRFLFWNIQGVLRAPNLKRVRKLVKLHSISLIMICEPKIAPINMDMVRVKIGMDYVIANQSGSVSVLYNSSFSCHTLRELD